MGSTIFGFSSGSGKCGVSVFRLSGPDCSNVWKMLTRSKRLPKPRYAQLTKLYDPQRGSAIDQCLALHFPGPKSFSGEDMLEFHVHGSVAVQQGLASALSCIPNVRMADAGEFTRRAFDNGKMTLTEVEGLLDLISSESTAQREQALNQLEGRLEKLYQDWRERLLRLLAHVEAVIDFADDEGIEDEVWAKVGPQVNELASEMQSHLNDQRRGEKIRAGWKMSIVGPPNSGKSSLYNVFLQRNAAIVTDIPGTTRDVLESSFEIGGHAIQLYDTAGVRETGDEVEQMGITRALQQYSQSDVRLLVVDGKVLCERDDVLDPFISVEERPSLVVVNKKDLLSKDEIDRIKTKLADLPFEAISCKEAVNIDMLLDRISELLGPVADQSSPVPVLTRERHRSHVSRSLESLRSFEQYFEMGPEVAAEELRAAMKEIAAISGHVTVDEHVLGKIFSEFCIGK